jgi:hypothetical protein
MLQLVNSDEAEFLPSLLFCAYATDFVEVAVRSSDEGCKTVALICVLPFKSPEGICGEPRKSARRVIGFAQVLFQ